MHIISNGRRWKAVGPSRLFCTSFAWFLKRHAAAVVPASTTAIAARAIVDKDGDPLEESIGMANKGMARTP